MKPALEALADLAEQRQSHYFAAIGKGAVALKNQIWAGDIRGAWEGITAAIGRIDASTSEYADEIWYKPDPGFSEAKLPAVVKANVQKLKELKAKKQGCE